LGGESAGHETRAEENADEDNFGFHVLLDFHPPHYTPDRGEYYRIKKPARGV
jgi:hypothetical protein